MGFAQTGRVCGGTPLGATLGCAHWQSWEWAVCVHKLAPQGVGGAGGAFAQNGCVWGTPLGPPHWGHPTGATPLGPPQWLRAFWCSQGSADTELGLAVCSQSGTTVGWRVVCRVGVCGAHHWGHTTGCARVGATRAVQTLIWAGQFVCTSWRRMGVCVWVRHCGHPWVRASGCTLGWPLLLRAHTRARGRVHARVGARACTRAHAQACTRARRACPWARARAHGRTRVHVVSQV